MLKNIMKMANATTNPVYMEPNTTLHKEMRIVKRKHIRLLSDNAMQK